MVNLHAQMIEGSRAGFLERFADTYAILADLRNSPGVTPRRVLKWWENWLWSVKPARAATSARDTSVPACRSCLARSTRRATTYRCGGSPVAALNCRAKW